MPKSSRPFGQGTSSTSACSGWAAFRTALSGRSVYRLDRLRSSTSAMAAMRFAANDLRQGTERPAACARRASIVSIGISNALFKPTGPGVNPTAPLDPRSRGPRRSIHGQPDKTPRGSARHVARRAPGRAPGLTRFTRVLRPPVSVVTLEAGSATPAGSCVTASMCLRWVRCAWAVA